MSAVAVGTVLCAAWPSGRVAGATSDFSAAIGLQAVTAPDAVAAAGIERGVIILKPGVDTTAAKLAVKTRLSTYPFTLVTERTFTGADLTARVPKHYAALSKHALTQPPAELKVKPERLYLFQKTFGVSWAYALSISKVQNAAAYKTAQSLTDAQMVTEWSALQEHSTMIKLGPQTLVGKLRDFYVVNGNWFAVKAPYDVAGKSVTLYDFTWSPDILRWSDFLYNVVGSPDPAEAVAGSLTSLMNTKYAEWTIPQPQRLNVGMLVSQSAFEALAMRHVWLDAPILSDPFAKGLIAQGVPQATVTSWVTDPIVLFKGVFEDVFGLFSEFGAKMCLLQSVIIESSIRLGV